VAVAFDVANNQKPDDGLILALVRAGDADPVFASRRERLLDPAEQLPILLVDPHDGARLARFVVKGLPDAHGRDRLRRGGGHGRIRGEKGQAWKDQA